MEGVLYVGKLPVTTDGKFATSTSGLAYVACFYHVSGRIRGERSCLEAAPKLPPKSGYKQESAMADHHTQVEAMLANSSSVIARLGALAVEPTFLAWVHEATW